MQQLATSLQAAAAFARRITWMAGSSQSQNHVAEPGAIITAQHFASALCCQNASRMRTARFRRQTRQKRQVAITRLHRPSHWNPPTPGGRSTCREGRYKTLKTKLYILQLWTSIFFTPLQNFSADNCKMSHRFTGSAFIQIYKTFFQMYLQFKSPVVIFKGPRGLNVLARYSHQTASFID